MTRTASSRPTEGRRNTRDWARSKRPTIRRISSASTPTSSLHEARNDLPSRRVAMRTFDHFIDGELTPSRSGKTFDDVDPTTGKVIARVAEGGAAEVDAA